MGHPKCYEISEICNYKLDSMNHLHPCRNGEHLQNCRMFECNMMYKCPRYHCIPWYYICDGKWDCPGGYDESTIQNCGSDRLCANLFKCKNSEMFTSW